MKFERFKLRANDTLEIQNPYTAPVSWTLKKKGSVMIPSAQFLATFTSDSANRWAGFKLRFNVKSTECHQELDASAGGVIESPNYPKKHAKKSYCEYRITASPGSLVNVTFTNMNLGQGGNYLAVNPTSELYYTEGSVLKLTGSSLPSTITSDSNLMRIFYYGKKKSKGFRLEYSEV